MRALTAILLSLALPLFAAEKKDPRSKLDEQIRAAEAAFQRGDAEGAVKTANAAVKDQPESVRARYFRSQLYTLMKQYGLAVKDLTSAIKLQPNEANLYQARGEAHFRNVDMEAAIKDWDETIRHRPDQEPHHWQRGIAHYYAGRYADGRRQFTIHQTVNSADVENAVFHFICTARAIDLKTAQKEYINIKGDKRIPMFEVHRLFAGNMTVAQVLEAARRPSIDDIVNRRPLSAQAKIRQEFYANYYIGLYYESHGQPEKARPFIMKAAKTADLNGYMGDCARVHAALILRSEKKKKTIPKAVSIPRSAPPKK
jgi:lipoprotein NlpI